MTNGRWSWDRTNLSGSSGPRTSLYAIQRKVVRAGGVAPPVFTTWVRFYRPERHNCQSPRTQKKSLRQGLHPQWSVPKTDASAVGLRRVRGSGAAPGTCALLCRLRSNCIAVYAYAAIIGEWSAALRQPERLVPARLSGSPSMKNLRARSCTLTTRFEALHAVCYITRSKREWSAAPDSHRVRADLQTAASSALACGALEMVPLAGFAPASCRLEGGCLICSSHRGVVRQPGVAPGRPLWKSGMLAVEHHWRGGNGRAPR